MKIEKIKNRNVLFTYSVPKGWDLNLHLIKGNKYNFIIDTGLGSLSVEPIKKDSVIISHKLCREMIESNWEEMMQKWKDVLSGETEMSLPCMTFENELYFPEDKVRIIYTPGHTVDSISVIDEEDKVLNAGDNIGDTVDEIIPSLYCEKNLYIDTLIKYSKLDFEFCVSGHNVILDKSVIERILLLLTSKI